MCAIYTIDRRWSDGKWIAYIQGSPVGVGNSYAEVAAILEKCMKKGK